jgi:2-dehydrotetronate isomerase
MSMPRFAANLSMLYAELPFMERFAACAADGFRAVEFLFPYGFEVERIAAELQRHRLRQVLFNAVPGDFEAGERGIAAVPGRQAAFREQIDAAIAHARAYATPCLHVMSGLRVDEEPGSRERQIQVLIDNLQWAAPRLAAHGITALLEPINERDIPGYLINTQAQAHEIVAAVGAPNVSVQMDLYHCQMVEGDVATKIRRYAGRFAHVQIAGVPGRHEPVRGELNYAYLFEVLDEVGYRGWVGCEYRPLAGTRQGLDWVRPWLQKGLELGLD